MLMFWIKFVGVLLLFTVVLVVGVELSAINTTLVTVNYILGKIELPLAWVFAWAFLGGCVMTVLVGCTVVLPLQWRVIRLQSQVAHQAHEIDVLRRKSHPHGH